MTTRKKQRYIISLLIVFFSLFELDAFAQSAKDLTEKEKQQLMEELDSFKKDLTKLKALKEKAQKLEEEVKAQEDYLVKLKEKFDENADRYEELVPRADSLTRVSNYWRKYLRNVRDNIIFKVQFASYKSHVVDRFAQNNPFFSVYNDRDGLKKYFLGNFLNYGESKKFNDWLRRRGVDSYVVAFKKGWKVSQLSSVLDY